MRTAAATILLLASTGLAACSPPGPPDEERRPAPRAAATVEAQPRAPGLQGANTYTDRARDVARSLEAADQRRSEVDAQAR